MAFALAANKGEFKTPSYVDCFKYFYYLDESGFGLAALILSRKYPSPLEHAFLWTIQHTQQGTDMFQRVISCYDFSLSDDHHSYELYAPNHFARQLGLSKKYHSLSSEPKPLLFLAPQKWCNTLADEADRYSVRFEFASMHFPPPIRRIVRSKEHSSAYLVFWNMLTKADWVLNRELAPALTGKQSLKKPASKPKAQVRLRRSRTTIRASAEESVQKQPTAPARTIAEIRMEETDSTSSEDEELTVQEEDNLMKP
ncbi:hypothetical protein M0R45_025733 [Rubus argutus]|uniref:Uncharacterized protein n=1 Tax=Rubus argutus TaxID=59490 RepID=A0AAW1WYV2_RUBAR